MSFEGHVYDVTNFVEDHPGGKMLLLSWAGQDVTVVFHEHGHSNYAVQVLADYKVGTLSQLEGDQDSLKKVDSTCMIAKVMTGIDHPNDKVITEKGSSNNVKASPAKRDDNFLDFTKPLMSQVWHHNWNKAYYLEQVHLPRHMAKSPLFFSSPILELFTRTTWYGVLLVWTPVIIGLLIYSANELDSLTWLMHLALDGFVLWTIYEYIFHRFLFHMDDWLPDHKIAITLHLLLHGIHHLIPMDRYRLVIPPLMLICLGLPVGLIWNQIVGTPTTAALMAGSLLGYLVYDMMHYFSHHGSPPLNYLRRMKKYHMDHHYANEKRGFGVSSMMWDSLFDTMNLAVSTKIAGHEPNNK